MAEIKKGDVVQMKSGGPKMTVMDVRGRTVVCQWFVDHEVKAYAFDTSSLSRVDSEG